MNHIVDDLTPVYDQQDIHIDVADVELTDVVRVAEEPTQALIPPQQRTASLPTLHKTTTITKINMSNETIESDFICGVLLLLLLLCRSARTLHIAHS